MDITFEVISSYEELSQFLPDFVELTMKYLLWIVRSKYDFNPDVWITRSAGASLMEELEGYQSQLQSKKFSEEMITITKKRYLHGMWTVLVFADTKLVATDRIYKRSTSECELHSVFVLPEYRGQKIGERMLRKTVEMATEIGFKTIYLTTYPFMTDAIRLYHACGFSEVEYIYFENYDRDDVLEEGIIFMKLDLQLC